MTTPVDRIAAHQRREHAEQRDPLCAFCDDQERVAQIREEQQEQDEERLERLRDEEADRAHDRRVEDEMSREDF